MQFSIAGLGVLFVGLKLAGVIDWSWWLVLLPFYGGVLVFFAMLAVLAGLDKTASRLGKGRKR